MSEAVASEAHMPAGESLAKPIRLREAREAAGLHIAALAAALKVPVKKLEALEAGRYSELPDLTFARALASSACRQLRVDPAPILQQIPLSTSPKLGDRGASINAPFNPGRDEQPISPLSWLSRPALLAAIALLLGALVIVFLPRAEAPPVAARVDEPAIAGPDPLPAGEPMAAEVAQVSPAADGGPVASINLESSGLQPATPVAATSVPGSAPATPLATDTSAASVAANNSTSLLSIAATGESWVEVVNGSGTVVTQRLLQAGDVIDFSTAPPYTVVLGKADAAQVIVRGKPFDVAPFSRSNVARFEVK